jgi:hypothetical protein
MMNCVGNNFFACLAGISYGFVNYVASSLYSEVSDGGMSTEIELERIQK